MKKLLSYKFRLLLVLGVAVALSACVTTQESSFTGKVSEGKALEARVQIAIGYLQTNDTEMAITHLNTALEIDSKSPRVHEVLGIAFQQSGEIELAEKHYKKSLKFDSNYSRGRNNYASFLYAQGRYKESKKQLERVVEDVYYDRRAQAFENLARNMLRLEQYEEAEKTFLRALGLDRRLRESSLELAQLYYDNAEYAKSQKYLDQYLAVSGRSSPRSLLLGVRLATEFDDKDTIASYSMVLKNLYPKSKEFLELKALEQQD